VNYNNRSVTDQMSENKKKKCRGNRKLQRFRAKLRRQGLDSNTITSLLENYHDRSDLPNNENQLILPNVNVETLVECSACSEIQVCYEIINLTLCCI